MEIFNLILIAVLIALTSFFVASEFAMVKVRGTRIDQLVAEKKRGALAAKKVVSNLDEYLSACQLGITVTALGLGWLGEPTVRHMLEPVFKNWNFSDTAASTVSFIIAFSFVTFLHVVVGELAPKTVAIQKADRVTLLLAQPLIWFYKLAYPFIRILNGSARILVGLFGMKPASEQEVVHSEEELRLILSESYKSGKINQAEYRYVENVFEFDNRTAKEIMVPRTEVVGLYEDDTIDTKMAVIARDKYTRYPVFGVDKDGIIGMINVKDLFIRYMNEDRNKEQSIQSYVRPVIEVMETILIHDLLLEMQKKRIPLAVIYDEYGGTSGIVTLEDILEEIVGEIHDEYDEDEQPPVDHISEHHKIVDGKMLIEEVNDLFGLEVSSENIDTIGDWVMMQNHDIQEGESVLIDGYEFKVSVKDEQQIKQVEIQKLPVEQSVTE